MVKYFVKKHCEATEALTIAVDRVQDYYYGKNVADGYVCRDREPKSFEGTLYGFGSRSEAEKLLASMSPLAGVENAQGQWLVTLSVEET